MFIKLNSKPPLGLQKRIPHYLKQYRQNSQLYLDNDNNSIEKSRFNSKNLKRSLTIDSNINQSSSVLNDSSCNFTDFRPCQHSRNTNISSRDTSQDEAQRYSKLVASKANLLNQRPQQRLLDITNELQNARNQKASKILLNHFLQNQFQQNRCQSAFSRIAKDNEPIKKQNTLDNAENIFSQYRKQSARLIQSSKTTLIDNHYHQLAKRSVAVRNQKRIIKASRREFIKSDNLEYLEPDIYLVAHKIQMKKQPRMMKQFIEI